jgi:hypothetical protein
MGDVTRQDLRDLRDELVEQMSRGFSGVNARLDLQNGRVGKSEVAIGVNSTQLANLEREVFRRHHGRSAEVVGADEDRGITRRDVAMLAFGGGGLIAAWKFIEWAVGMLRQLP